MTSRPQKGCSGAPKPNPSPYRGSRAPRTTQRQSIQVVVPDDPPALTPRAARALLRALLEANERDGALHPDDEKDGRSI